MSARFLTAAAACALLVPAAAQAQSEVSASADVTVAGGYSDNPFSAPNGDTGSAFGQLAVRPKVVVKSERSTFTIDGDVQLQEYAEKYSLVDSYVGRIRYDGTPSERISLNAQASYSDRFIGAFDYFEDTPDISEPDPVTGSDLGLIGTRARRRSIEGQAGLSGRLSERGRIALTGFAADANYSGPNNFDYTSFGGSLGYSHRLNEHTELGARVSVSSSDYQSVIIDDSNVYSGQATLSTALSERWKLEAAAGVTVSQREGLDDQVSGTGSLSLCNRSDRTTFCVRAARAVLPSGVLGTVTETRVEANLQRRTSEYGTITAAASFVRADSEVGFGSVDRDYGYGSIGYSHRLSERLNLTSNVFYRVLGGTGNPKPPTTDDFGGQIGLVYRLGDPR